ncbi:unnamed protein product, partial [Allacma fusca]
MSKIEKSVKIVAWIELAFTVLQISTGIYALVVVSQTITDSKRGTPMKPGDPKLMVNYMAIVAIKLVYLAILFFISEILLACFLLRAVYHKRLNDLRIWIIVAMVYASLYMTDFVSTLHVMSLFENISVTLGIFIKIPLLVLVYKYYNQLSVHGENLVEE